MINNFIWIALLFNILLRQELQNAYPKNSEQFNLLVGEELIYRVSWGFLRLGTIRLSIVDTTKFAGLKTYHSVLKLDSNPWLFFVNMHSRFDSYLMPDTYPRLLICQEEIDGDTYNSRYDFDYKNKEIRVHYEGVDNPENKIDTQMPWTGKLQDGISIVFYARTNCHKSMQEKLSVIYETKVGIMDIDFSGRIDSIDVSFSENKIPAYYLNGMAHFQGTAGFSDAYEGWFSIDNQHVPLAARMKVFVGSVYVELEDWKNWNTSLIDPK